MRIISQFGQDDLEYERCYVWRSENEIYCNTNDKPDKDIILAYYSDPEKAEKAMKFLHEAYSGMQIIFQNVEIPEIDADKFKNILDCSIIASIPNEQPKVEYINKAVFQFPKEEDLL